MIIYKPLFFALINRCNYRNIETVLEYIHVNLHKKLRLSEIAGMAHMSESNFCRYFKEKTKRTLFGYIIDCRLSRAKQLLRETSLSVLRIGLDSGFNNLSNFNRAFKKREGIKPMEYRQRTVRHFGELT